MTIAKNKKDNDRQDEAKIKSSVKNQKQSSREYGGREGPDPTRFGDWEKGGRCIDF